jgi:hypothetical protein
MNGSDPMPEHDNEISRLKAEIERLKHTQISADHVTIAQAAALQAQRADALERKVDQLTKALNTAMILIDELVSENGRLCAASNTLPPVRLFAAKNSFDVAMKKLLSES